MFERFSDAARQVVVDAADAARAAAAPQIGVEHLRAAIDGTGGRPPREAGAGQLPFTREAKEALQRAAELGGTHVEPEHIAAALG